ncbi:acyl-CoA-binding protein [Polaribacter sp.]|nr:acyl-CoA-binding protein [Polaribacter sp.]MDB9736122.1 acyl-CoA-binding protein [Polaribacter sp.]MDB9853513.1 acyl-CoA-binding protein [bacterium]|tara:strand:- start:9058 stop:9324 length:267 start_codon:yes stop_codon:yes gene_type:complete
MNSDVDLTFKEAFMAISKLKEPVAADTMLKFYAYYKQATAGSNFPFDGKLDVRNAFKINAWMQLKDMSSDQAKKEYIKLAKAVLKNKK